MGILMQPIPTDSYQSLNQEELIKLAAHSNENLQFEKAIQILELALTKSPNAEVYDLLGDAYIGISNDEKAMNAIMKCIVLAPTDYPLKYFQLAQYNDGKAAVELFRKGINIIENGNSQILPEVNAKLSSAYSSIAEIYMTDLCDEPNAQHTCEESLGKALKYDQYNFDALLRMSNFLLILNKDENAKGYLNTLHQKIKELEPNLQIDFYKEMSKLLMEVEKYEEAAEYLDRVIKMDDSSVGKSVM